MHLNIEKNKEKEQKIAEHLEHARGKVGGSITTLIVKSFIYVISILTIISISHSSLHKVNPFKHIPIYHQKLALLPL